MRVQKKGEKHNKKCGEKESIVYLFLVNNRYLVALSIEFMLWHSLWIVEE